jgi:hypothetical protein
LRTKSSKTAKSPETNVRSCSPPPRPSTEQAALKILYLAVTSLDPTGKGRARWSNRWKAALNAFDITFDGRISAARR